MFRRIISIAFAAGLVPAQAFAADPSTRIFFNGSVLTMDASDRVAEAVAIDGDRIVAVGSNDEVQKLAGPRTKVLDLGGRTLIPGLGDAHNHAIRACGFRKPQIRAYRWCSPPRIGCAIMSPNRSIGRVQGASLPSER